MDTGIINVDINFGEQKDDALKKSPYHESDSGVADTIENLKADRIPILQLFTIFVVNPVGEMFGAK
ncbi:uncharacterized protein LOC143064695 isoform X2 [Mytilus galloprovincialis]|uniref:uncharacterized protein LOC143064695 isoform X2 n=1 Tax=Mytilus galloprovincialis TaxID=29158 RepID=UPI003F7C7718